MKRLQLILSIGFLTLGLSLSVVIFRVGLAYIRYGLDKVSGTFFDDVGKYMPVWLIVLIVLSFLIQLGIIFYKDE